MRDGKELLADVDDDEEKKTGTREKLLIHQVFVFDHHSMHFLSSHVRSTSWKHIKNQKKHTIGRKGGEQSWATTNDQENR